MDRKDRFRAEHWIGKGTGRLLQLCSADINQYDFQKLKSLYPVPRARLENGLYWDGERLRLPELRNLQV
jgi:hypothetical protein